MMGGDDRGERRPGGRGGRLDLAVFEGSYQLHEQENKEGGAPGEFAPIFRSGFGRGRSAAPYVDGDGKLRTTADSAVKEAAVIKRFFKI
jgi:hypothetical protein